MARRGRFDVRIDGEPVEEEDEYWGEVQQTDDGSWIVRWRYATPPKEPGLCELEMTFGSPSASRRGTVRKPGTVDTFTGYYEVQSEDNGR